MMYNDPIQAILPPNCHYIYSPMEFLNSEWRWDKNKFSALPKDKFIIVNASSENWGMGNFIDDLYINLEEQKIEFVLLSHLPDDHFKKPNLLFYPYWYHWAVRTFKPKETSNTKKYKVSCLNRSPRPHRVINYFELKNKPYQSDMFITAYQYSVARRDDDCDLTEDLVDKWNKEANFLPNFENHVSDYPALHNSYINLVTETTVTPRLFVTEKTWKAIAAEQLFLILGSPNTVSYLRKCGVDTFDDIIDHNYYDNVLDFGERFKRLHILLDDLVTLDLDQIYKYTEQRRRENRNKFFNGELNPVYQQVLTKILNNVSIC